MFASTSRRRRCKPPDAHPGRHGRARDGRVCAAFAGALAAFALAACTVPPVLAAVAPSAPAAPAPGLAETYAQLRASGGKVLTVDPRASEVRIYVFRGGGAARFGHNHVLVAPRFRGYLHLPGAGISGARFDLEFRLDDLELDRPDVRAALGPEFAGTLTDGDIAATRAHMLGEEDLQADRFPVVRVGSLQVMGAAPRVAAQVRIEMHGRTRDLWVPLSVTGLPYRLRVQGSFVLMQSDFGVQPYSVLGGLLAVQDPVAIEFTLAAG
jgi:hypothetical protein